MGETDSKQINTAQCDKSMKIKVYQRRRIKKGYYFRHRVLKIFLKASESVDRGTSV